MDDIQEELEQIFPELFKDEFGNEVCMVDVGGGWSGILEILVHLIKGHVSHTNETKPGNFDLDLLQFRQIKEKFGKLRVYISGGDLTIDAYIQFAEAMSAKICEISGAPGVLCINDLGLYKTLSPDVALVEGFKEAHQ
jgi:hypothetical protein